MWHLNILQLKSYIIACQNVMLEGEESSSMKVLCGSLNQDLVSQVQRGCSKCLGSRQNISSLRWPWYNQDETSMHSLTVQGFETSSLGWSCPNSCCVRCSWGQSQQVAWKAVDDVLEDVFLPVWRNSKIGCPAHKAPRYRSWLSCLVVIA